MILRQDSIIQKREGKFLNWLLDFRTTLLHLFSVKWYFLGGQPEAAARVATDVFQMCEVFCQRVVPWGQRWALKGRKLLIHPRLMDREGPCSTFCRDVVSILCCEKGPQYRCLRIFARSPIASGRAPPLEGSVQRLPVLASACTMPRIQFK